MTRLERAAWALAAIGALGLVAAVAAGIYTGDLRLGLLAIPAGLLALIASFVGAVLAGQRTVNSTIERVGHFDGLPPKPPLMRRRYLAEHDVEDFTPHPPR